MQGQREVSYLSHVKAGKIFFEDISLYQKIEKITSAHVLEYLVISIKHEIKSEPEKPNTHTK